MPDAPLQTDIVIIGGGVAGMAAAIALAPYGMRITVLERRAQVGGIHRGDSLLPKAMAVLAELGLRPALEAAGARPIDTVEVHPPGGGTPYCAPLTPPAAALPYYVLPHALLEAVLMEHLLRLPQVTVLRPAAFRDLQQQDGLVSVRYQQHGAEHDIHCRWAIAADGQRSAVRKRLGITFAEYAYDHAYLGLEASRPASYRDAMRVHFHADGGVLLMPHPDRIGVGMLVDAGSARHWLSMDEPTLLAELVQRAPILAGMSLNCQGMHVYELTRAHAERYVVDRVAIIGDAAHCTNPTAGQGMAMALTDAAALAAAIGPAWQHGDTAVNAALLHYQAAQWPDNQRLVRQSHLLALVYALRGPLWTRLKLLGVTLLARPALRRITDPLVARFTQKPR